MMPTILERDSFYETWKEVGSDSHVVRFVEGFKGNPAVNSPSYSQGGAGGFGLPSSDVLLDKGPMPINALGPKVDLNVGSVSVAVERLHKKGLVSRVESASDRRVRTVSLTEKGRRVFDPIFRRHAVLIESAFQDVSAAEQRLVEEALERIARRADELAEREVTVPATHSDVAKLGGDHD